VSGERGQPAPAGPTRAVGEHPQRGGAGRAARWALWIVGGAITLAALWAVRGQWQAVTAEASELRPRWSGVAASGAIVLLNYALLIEVWRRVVLALGEQLSWGEAARIWFVSNLARYLPGALWQIGVLSVLAKRARVSPAAATGSAVLVTVINTLTGVAVAIASGAGVVRFGHVPAMMAAGGALLIVALPVLLPWAEKVATVALRRPIALPRLPSRVVWLVVAGTTAAWVVYGVAFQLLDRALFAEGGASPARYVAAYTASYLSGLFSPTPAGLGVSDSVLANLYVAFGIGALPRAAVVAVVSRLWRTVLEIVPGTALMVWAALTRPSGRPGLTP
jgi:uncharacterized membrane protein YbhN (UPF0104 family)